MVVERATIQTSTWLYIIDRCLAVILPVHTVGKWWLGYCHSQEDQGKAPSSLSFAIQASLSNKPPPIQEAQASFSLICTSICGYPDMRQNARDYTKIEHIAHPPVFVDKCIPKEYVYTMGWNSLKNTEALAFLKAELPRICSVQPTAKQDLGMEIRMYLCLG